MKRIFVLILLLISIRIDVTSTRSAQEILEQATGVAWSLDGSILAISGSHGLWFYYVENGILEYITSEFAFNGWTTDNRIFTGKGFFNPITHL
ncbi:MAG: hypothetical protein K8F30_09350, partial [Taibaiella sp.]|nr:hypothetical protein [Taibaiella sp.]